VSFGQGCQVESFSGFGDTLFGHNSANEEKHFAACLYPQIALYVLRVRHPL
jgi:hypothetical protein